MRNLVLLLSVAFSSVAIADDNGYFLARGYGNDSCGAYADARQNPALKAASYGTWVTGYLTATNYLVPNVYDVANTDLAGVMGWLDNYCKANPTMRFALALSAFVRAQQDVWVRKAPP